MGNSGTKGANGKKSRRSYKPSIKFPRQHRNSKDATKQHQNQNQEEPNTRPTPKRTLSLRPDGNTIDTVLPRYYDVDWSKTGEIGRGHYATVFRGVYKATGQPVAVKRIKRSLARPQTLKTEIRALAAVRGHPNIVQMHDVFYNNKHVVLVMELLGGGELFDRIVQNGAYSERDASQHVRKIASALQYMHSQGIVHRDMKPENLVLVDKSPNSEIKISDFGLSKILNEDQTTMVTVCGTRAYSAPEVNFGGPARSGRYTEKVDTWSLGVILYVILAAYHPFDPYGDSNDSEIWARICNGQWDFNDEVWDSVSPEAKDLIKNCICIDPNRRFGTKEILNHKWVIQYQQMPGTPLRSSGNGFSTRSLMKLAGKLSEMNDAPEAAHNTQIPMQSNSSENDKMLIDADTSMLKGGQNTVNHPQELKAVDSQDVVMSEVTKTAKQDFEKV